MTSEHPAFLNDYVYQPMNTPIQLTANNIHVVQNPTNQPPTVQMGTPSIDRLKLQQEPLQQQQHQQPSMAPVQPRKRFSCNLCDTSFSRRDKLKRHYANIHMKEQPFTCNHCTFKCDRRDRIRHHLNSVHRADPNDFTYQPGSGLLNLSTTNTAYIDSPHKITLPLPPPQPIVSVGSGVVSVQS